MGGGAFLLASLSYSYYHIHMATTQTSKKLTAAQTRMLAALSAGERPAVSGHNTRTRWALEGRGLIEAVTWTETEGKYAGYRFVKDVLTNAGRAALAR